VSDKSESVLPDEPSSLKRAVEVITSASLQGNNDQTGTVNLGQLETQVCDKEPARHQEQHIPAESPSTDEGVISKEQAFQMLLNVLTGNYSDIPQAKAFRESILVAFNKQPIAQTTSHTKAYPEISPSQQKRCESSGETGSMADSESVYENDYLFENPPDNKRDSESMSLQEYTTEKCKLFHEPHAHQEVSKSFPELKITVENKQNEPNSKVKQWSPKMESASNVDMSTIPMNENLYVVANPRETESLPTQLLVERVDDTDGQYHNPIVVPLKHRHVEKEILQNIVQCAPSFQEHCADEEDDDYEEYVTNDEMEEEDYEEQDEKEEENEEIIENLDAVTESPIFEKNNKTNLDLADTKTEKKLVLQTSHEIVTNNKVAFVPPEQAETENSVNSTVNSDYVSAPSTHEMEIQDPPHSSRSSTSDIAPCSNTQSFNTLSSAFTSMDAEVPIPPKRKSAKSIRNLQGVTIHTTSINNVAMTQNSTMDLTQSSSSQLEVVNTTNSDNQLPASVKENCNIADEYLQPTELHSVNNESLKKQDEVTSTTTDMSSTVTDQFQFEVSLQAITRPQIQIRRAEI
jgi:hypothetical protein